MTAVGEASINATGGQNSVEIVKPEIMITPAAGSHVFQFMQKLDASGAGVTLVNAAGSYGAVETVKQSGVNNTVTTG